VKDPAVDGRNVVQWIHSAGDKVCLHCVSTEVFIYFL